QGVGVYLFGPGTRGNSVVGNRIGTDASGNVGLAGSVGIQLYGPNTRGNTVQGNALGLSAAGRLSLPNGRGTANGVFINTTPGANTVRGNFGQTTLSSLLGSVYRPFATASASAAGIKSAARRPGPFSNRAWSKASALPST
ncbi:MAG: hypothetical protein LC745_06215, partial [Planctomycetia bacterium]|nr:hypothetical protein [Planctomycetia bacterium]